MKPYYRDPFSDDWKMNIWLERIAVVGACILIVLMLTGRIW